MVGVTAKHWEWLGRWSPAAFAISGIGSLSVVAISVFEIVVYGQRFQVVPEWGIAVIGLPTFFATFVGLLGFYPWVADASRWLARGGGLAAAIGGASLVLAAVGGIVLQLLGGLAFTEGENNPALLALFLLVMSMLLLSFLLYGVASTLTKTPSRTVGLLLLLPIVEPLFTLVFDVLADIEIPGGPLGTLAVEGLALVALGYLLRTDTEPTDRPESEPEPIA